MTTKTTTRTFTSTSGKTIEVTLERGTWTEDISLDGMICGTKTHLVNCTTIALYDGSKCLAEGDALNPLPKHHSNLDQAIKTGCVGIVGKWFIKPETAQMIRKCLAEVEAENPQTQEMIFLERESDVRKHVAEENLNRQAAEYANDVKNGMCPKCGTWCYGDCTAN